MVALGDAPREAAYHDAIPSARPWSIVEGIMTDAGGFETDAAAADERERLLRQIAEALNIPLTAFRNRVSWAPDAAGPNASECVALLTAFSRIEDPERRRACLALVERFSAP